MAESCVKFYRKKAFATLYREVAQDDRLSLEARGLLILMASLPEDWEYSVAGLAKKAGCGKDKLRRILGELERVGYLAREQSHDRGGKFAGNVYIIQDDAPPLSGKPDNGETRQRFFPSSGNPTEHKIDLTVEEQKDPPYNPPKGEAPARKRKRSNEPKEAPDWKPERFNAFWEAYPCGKSKQAAIRAWDKLRPDDSLLVEMARGLQRALRSEDWQRGIGIPYASTWLNNRRWEDEDKPLPASEQVPSGAPAPVLVAREEVPTW